MRPSLFRFLAPAAFLSLAGCISFGAEPPPSLFNLTAEQRADSRDYSGSTDSAIIVEEPATSARLAVLRVPVQIDASNVAYLKDAQWVERPSRLMQALLAETLRNRTGRVVFEDSDTDAVGAVRVSGRLLEMGYDATSGSVVVRYDALLHRGEGPAAARRFEATESGIAADASAVGPALNRAANKVAGDIAAWVAG